MAVSVVWVEVESRPLNTTLRSWETWKPWSIPSREAIPSRRCGGPARAPASWPRQLHSAGPQRQPPDGGRLLQRARLQPPVQPQDPGGGVAPRSQRPVRAHQRAGPPVPEAGPAGHLGGHQEEGIGRGFQERRAGSGSPQGQPEEVRVHDFQDKALGKAIPYGVYDMTANEGWVSVGIDHDTARVRRRVDSAVVGRTWARRSIRRPRSC